MKKLVLVIALINLVIPQVFSQVKCKFIVYTHKFSDSSVVYITGNYTSLGNWNPSLVPLIRLNDTTWYGEFYFDLSQALEFKFTLGSWEKEARSSDGKKLPNFNLKLKGDTVLMFTIKNWGTESQIKKGKITGKVYYHRNFESKNILPRDIIVWLPPSYDSLISKRYPVLYMNDGQNIIDPATSAFGIDWQIDETADSLIKNGSIKELIIVGIYNTEKRSLEYSQSDIGNTYMEFIISELKPFIDFTYRTLPDKNNTAISGSSLGGLISFMLVWEYDNVFSKAACFSPAFKIEQFDYVAPIENYFGSKKDIKLYIDNGGKGIDKRLQPGIDQMLIALSKLGYKMKEDLLWIKDQEADHNEAAWAKRVPEMLKFLFPALN